MGFRGRMRIVRFVRMGQHRIGECGFDCAADHIRCGHRRNLFSGMFACELDRKAAGREFGAGDHSGEGIQNMLLGLF